MPLVLYLVDASVFIFRAYYSVPIDLTDRDGNPVNAVHGFARFLGDLLERESPGHVAVAFDESLERSYRNEIYPAYKANREPAPPELKRQFALCRDVVRALGIAEYGSSRYEADDIIGTLAALGRREGQAVTIVSRDKDLTQLVTARDIYWDAVADVRYGYDDIEERFGVVPERMADFLALMGDAVDNIPGVPGVGPQDGRDAAQALRDARGRVREPRRRAEAQVPWRELRRAEPARAPRTGVPVAATDRHRLRHAAGRRPHEDLRRRPPDLAAARGVLRAHGFGRMLREQARRVALAVGAS